MGGTGLFAALTDTAHTGTNSVDSAALPSSADLKLATATYDATGFHCGPFTDDLATGLISLTDTVPQLHYGNYYCIKNAGSQTVSLSGAVDELIDLDTACTGDEADSGDASCGGNGIGELSGVFEVNFGESDCMSGQFVANYGPSLLSTLQNTPTASGTLGAGQQKCFGIDLGYGLNVDPDAVQRAQSDRVTWRFLFIGHV